MLLLRRVPPSAGCGKLRLLYRMSGWHVRFDALDLTEQDRSVACTPISSRDAKLNPPDDLALSQRPSSLAY